MVGEGLEQLDLHDWLVADAVGRHHAAVEDIDDAKIVGGGGAIFAAGGAKILVHERAGGIEDGPPNEDHFALAVEDLNAACDELVARGLTLELEPRDYPWGRSAYLRDPDGRLVELAQL